MLVIGSRLLSVIPTLVIVLLMAMVLMDLAPIDPAVILAGENASPQQIAVIRHLYHLDEPLLQRYATYLVHASQGDLGIAFRTGRPVSALIAETLPVTGSLGLLSMVFVVLLGFPAGLLAALQKDKLPDRLVSGLASMFVAIPPFVIALVLVIAVAVRRAWFPATGYVALGDGIASWLHHLILPAFALALASAAETARQIRGTLIDTQEQEFIRAQYAKGLSRFWIIGKHAAKNAAIPVVTVLGLQVTRILGGAVIIEEVFVLPGFGDLAFQAVLTRDFALIQGIVLVSAIIVMAINLAVDLSYFYFNPRTRTFGRA